MKKGFSPGFFRCNIILPSLVVLQMRLGSFEKPQFDTKLPRNGSAQVASSCGSHFQIFKDTSFHPLVGKDFMMPVTWHDESRGPVLKVGQVGLVVRCFWFILKSQSGNWLDMMIYIYTRYGWDRSCRRVQFFGFPISWVKYCFCPLKVPNSYLMWFY